MPCAAAWLPRPAIDTQATVSSVRENNLVSLFNAIALPVSQYRLVVRLVGRCVRALTHRPTRRTTRRYWLTGSAMALNKETKLFSRTLLTVAWVSIAGLGSQAAAQGIYT